MNQVLRELYQQVILDHNKSPRNFRKMENPTQEAYVHNHLCGDTNHIYLKVENIIIIDVSFDEKGCAITKESSSTMS